MAIKLYQGADSALASAAYKAAAAQAPADVSGVMQSVAASYDRTLRAQAQMWGNIGKAATQVGLAIHKDIKTVPPEGTDYIIGDLDKTQDMMKISYGLKADENGNRLNPFSREAKELRSQARQERSRLFAEAEYELEGLKTITAAHDSGLVDPVMTGLQNMEMSHAAVATSRGKTTDYGNYFKWEDIDGARKWVLYHDPSKIKENAPVIEGLPSSLTNGVKTDKDGRVLNSKGEITATTTAEIAQNLMFDKLDNKGIGVVRGKKRATAFNIQERGFNSSVPYAQLDEYQKNYLQELIDGEKNDRVSWFTPSHADPDMRSFYNRVTNADGKGASQINAEMFVQIGNLTGYEFEKGKGLKKEGALAGLTDTDKDGYISEKEFLQQDNVKLFGASLFGGENYDPELTAALYADDAERNYAAIFDNGFSKRPTDTGGDTELTNSIKVRDNVISAWKSGNIDGLALPYGRSISYDKENKRYVLLKIDGTEIMDFRTPDNEVLLRILGAHGVQEKDLGGIDFTTPLFKTPETKETSFMKFDPSDGIDKEDFRIYLNK